MQRNLIKTKNLVSGLLIILVCAFSAIFALSGVFSAAPNRTQTPIDITSSALGYTANVKDGNPDGTVLNARKGIAKNGEWQSNTDTANKILNENFVSINYNTADETAREAVHIDFGSTDSGSQQVTIYSVSLKIGNTNVKVNPVTEVPGGLGNYYSQEFYAMPASYVNDLSITQELANKYTTYGLSNNALENVEGEYSLEIRYRKRTASQTDPEQILTYKFYLITEETYNPFQQFDLRNTVLVENSDANLISKNHYFNYTNLYDPTGALLGAAKAAPAYPTLTYNPEKFVISYTRVLYNVSDAVTLTFNNGVLTETTKRGSQTLSTKTYTCTYDAGKQEYTAKLTLTAAGVYTFNKTCILKRSDGSFISATAIVGNKTMLKSEKMDIFGFSPLYSSGGSGEAPFYNDTYVSDATFNAANDTTLLPSALNTINLGNQQTKISNMISQGTPFLPASLKRASTNQGPVFFDYFANLTSGSYSYYYHTSLSGITTGPKTISSKGVRFSEAGTYVVVLTYDNFYYSSTSLVDFFNTQTFTQIFTFEIRSTPPDVKILASNNLTDPTSVHGINPIDGNTVADERIISSASFTNKNVWLQWEQEGPFDCQVRAVYDWVRFNGAQLNNLPLTAQTYTWLSGVGLQPHAVNPTVFKNDGTADGKYTVRVYHENSNYVYLAYSFTIDTRPISGVTALQVNPGNTLAVENNAAVSVSSQTTYNLATSSNFGFTWDTKKGQNGAPNGAQIYASYIYAPLSEIPGFALDLNEHPIAAPSNEEWMPSGWEFGSFTAAVDYSRIALESFDLSQIITIPASQIFKQNMFIILLLRDAAGNTAIFPIIRENIKPVFMRVIDGALQGGNQETSQDTTVIWGSHKAISLGGYDSFGYSNADLNDLLSLNTITLNQGSPSELTYSLQNFTQSQEQLAGNLRQGYFTVPHQEITADRSDSQSSGDSLDVSQYTRATVIVEVSELGSSTLKETYLRYPDGRESDRRQLSEDDTYNYVFYIKDALENTNTIKVNINLDKARGTMYTYGDSFDLGKALNSEDDSISNLLQGRVTNRRNIVFTWMDNNDDFAVEYVTLEFYPLVYDFAQTYANGDTAFPYRSTPSLTLDLYRTGITPVYISDTDADNNNYFGTTSLNQSYSAVFSNTASTPGKYVITRKYTDDSLTAGQLHGDKIVRAYTYFVDRNKPVSNVDRVVSGSFETYKIGADTHLMFEDVPFDRFSRANLPANEFSFNFNLNPDLPEKGPVSPNSNPSSIAITSNKLPAKIFSYDNKYMTSLSTLNEADLATMLDNNLNSMSICAVVQMYAGNSPTEQKFYLPGMGNDLVNDISSNHLKRTGYYRVIIFDLANFDSILPNQNASLNEFYTKLGVFQQGGFTPNYTIFNFEIEGIPPSATFQHVPTGAGSSGFIPLHDNIYVNSSQQRFVFEDSNDEYIASIDPLRVTVTRKIGSISTTISLTGFNDPLSSNIGPDYYLSDDTSAGNLNLLNAALPSSDTFIRSSVKYYKVLIPGSSPERYRYYLLLPATTVDAQYQAYVCYTGNRSDYEKPENFERTVTLNIDHTAPQKNLLTLIDNDTYLATLPADNAAAYSSKQAELRAQILANERPSFLQNYAFAISSSGESALRYFDNSDTDGISGYWYRPYKKFAPDAPTQNPDKQTVVPGDPRFGSGSEVNFFTPNSSTDIFKQAHYQNRPINPAGFTKFSDFINADEAKGGGGYFDIIERDQAGNYRVYTVLIAGTQSPNEQSTIQISATSSRGNFLVTNDSYTTSVHLSGVSINSNSVSAGSVQIAGIDMTDQWFTISYRDISTNPSASWVTYRHQPYQSNFNTFLNDLNSYMTNRASQYSSTVGACIEIRITNRFAVNSGGNMNFYVKTPGQRQDITFSQPSSSYFTATMPTETASTQYVGLVVYKNGDLEHPLSFDNSTPTPKNFNPPYSGITYRFTSGSYVFYLTDNFGSTYMYHYALNVDNTFKYLYSSGYTEILENNEQIKYTYNTVTLQIQSLLYKVGAITVIDQDTGLQLSPAEISTLYAFSSNSSGIYTYTFRQPAEKNYKYAISVFHIADEHQTTEFKEVFVIYTALPKIEFLDTNLNNIWYENDANMTTSRAVTVNIGSGLMFNPKVSIAKDLGSPAFISSGYTIPAAAYGDYTLTVSNDLGNKRTYKFTIKESSVNVYSVLVTEGTGSSRKTTEILPIAQGFSAHQFVDNMDPANPVTVDMVIPHYFYIKTATNSCSVEVNDDKNLHIYAPVAWEYGNTKIYKVYGTTTLHIVRYFAVTFVTYASSEQNITATSALTAVSERVYPPDQSKKFSWNARYIDVTAPFGNTVYNNFFRAEIWFNNNYVGSFNTRDASDPDGWCSVTLTEPGEYRIALFDLAGRQHKFGGTSLYYTVTLLTKVLFSLNNDSPIDYAVYNGSVVLQVLQMNQYRADSLKVDIYLNRVKLNLSGNNGRFTLTQAGFYEISFSASIAGLSAATQPITNSVTFTVINANEARLSYEFTPTSGYKITKIIKSNVDITSSVLAAQSQKAGEQLTEIRSYFASSAETGIGVYEVTVEVAASGLKPLRTYTFKFWINDAIPLFNPSVPFGSAVTENITITYNGRLIYDQVGDAVLKITGANDINITASSSENGSIKLIQPGTYYVQLYSKSGNLISSHRFVINVPLNAAAIVLIVAVSLVVIGIIATFIIFRTRMRVR